MRIIIFAIFILLRDVDCARVLGLFSHTGKSHHMVFEPLLLKLAERGHHVTVASYFPIKNPPVNYTEVNLHGVSDVGSVEIVDLSFFEQGNRLLELIPPLGRFVQMAEEFQPLAGMALDNCKNLVKWQSLIEVLKKEYDVILVETFNSDCMLGLIHIYGIQAPIVALSSTVSLPWVPDRFGLNYNPSYVPATVTSFTDKMNFLERLENTILTFYFKTWYRYGIQVKEQAIIEKHYGRKIPDLNDMAKNVSLLILNVFHSWNGNMPLVPGVVEAGGMHLDKNKRQYIPNHIEKFLNDSAHGVILFSFGSLIKTSTMSKNKEQTIINVLSKLKQRVIWKFEDSEENGTIIGNILRVKWIPQYELLRHPKVVAFIAHGGMLGMTEALSTGTPMIVVPFYGDQMFNGACAASRGFAKVLEYVDLTEESFTAALQTVLSDEMRVNARRASQIWADRIADPLETAVYSIERVIRWGPHDPLLSSARDLKFYEYLLLDVSAACVIALIVIILSIKTLIALIFRFCNYIFFKEGKKKVH